MGPQKKIVTNEYGEQVATSNEDYVAVAAREAPVKGLGFAAHRTSKLEEIKAQAFGTTSTLAASSSSSGVKAEVKDEVKEEVKRERDDDTASIVDGIVDVRAKEARIGSKDLKRERSGSRAEPRTKSDEKKDKIEKKKKK